MCVHIYMCVWSVIYDSATPWTTAHQAPLSMGLPRQEYWSTLLFPALGIFPIQGSDSCLLSLLHWQTDSLLLRHLESIYTHIYIHTHTHTQTCGNTYVHAYMYMYLLYIRTKFQITRAKKYSWSSWSEVS